MKKLIYGLEQLVGTNVIITTTHKWFGKEKFECEFAFINDDSRIGFKISYKEIYILKKDLVSFELLNNVYYIRDALMEISIVSL